MLRQRHDGEFQFAVGNRDAGIFRIHEVQVQIDPGIADLELAQSLWQSMQADVVAGGEAQATAWCCLLSAQTGPKGLQLLQNAFCMLFECPAIGGQDTALADTIKQQGINGDLELAYTLANRGLSDVQPLGGKRERLELSDGKKGTNLIDLHLF